MKTSAKFGYYPEPLDWKAGDVRVSTLPGLAETANAVSKDEGVENGWIYAPRERTEDFISGAVTEQPYSARVFPLPKTHLLEHQNADSDEHVSFLVWCLDAIEFLDFCRALGKPPGWFVEGWPS